MTLAPMDAVSDFSRLANIHNHLLDNLDRLAVADSQPNNTVWVFSSHLHYHSDKLMTDALKDHNAMVCLFVRSLAFFEYDFGQAGLQPRYMSRHKPFMV